MKERKIHPEVAKRNKQVIPVFAVQRGDEDNEPTVITKTIGRSQWQRFTQHLTKSSCHSELQPIEVVIRNRSQNETSQQSQLRLLEKARAGDIMNI